MPGKLRDSNLSDLSKKKLQDLFDTCWKPEEIKEREDAIQERSKHRKGSAEYKKSHEIVAKCHQVATERLVEKAATVLAGSELKLFYSMMGK